MLASLRGIRSPVLGNVARSLSSVASEVTDIPTKRVKHKIPEKRASKLLNDLRNELVERSPNQDIMSSFIVGNAVEVKVRDSLDPSKTGFSIDRGIVIAKSNKGISSNFTVLSVVMEDPVERTYMAHSPMVESIKVLQSGKMPLRDDSKKRMRRAKLYYVKEFPLHKLVV